jgi:hypothetical protein
MSILILTPTEIEDPLYTSELSYIIPPEEGVPVKGEASFPDPEALWETRPPVVTLGQPRNLGIFGEDFPLPSEVKKLAERADYYLVRLACSFRPSAGSQVTYAKLSVFLQPYSGRLLPIAFDLYPRNVYKSVEGEFKVSIAPGLKFVESAEISLGKVAAIIQFRELQPVIIGAGVQQSDPSWEFEAQRGQPLRGARFLYLIVERPRGAEAVRVIIDLSADVKTKHGLLAAVIKEQDRDHLTTVICGD